jgi:hypothetical protein
VIRQAEAAANEKFLEKIFADKPGQTEQTEYT